MDMTTILAMLVWTGAGAVLLFLLMVVDSMFTKYKDLEEIRKGNLAVTLRFVLKLIAQSYILSESIRTSNNLGEALLVSIVSFVILLIIEWLVRMLLRAWIQINLDEETQKGKVSFAMIAGTLHIAGALIIASTL